MDLASGVMAHEGDVARKAFKIRQFIKQLQTWHTNIEKVCKYSFVTLHMFSIFLIK